MHCEKCHFECDSEDVFCRRCGNTLAHEVAYSEENPVETVVGEVTTLEVIQNAPHALEKPGRFSRLGNALRSENAQKLARGAALVAVGVGIELAAHALNKLSQNPSAPGTALAPRLPDSISLPATDHRPIIIESVTYQRIYTRRIIRRIQ